MANSLSTEENSNNLNDMTKTGVWCINNDGHEMEQVTGENRYTCHYCGAVIEVYFKGH